jgi:precorrin-6A/cobalt-precorrin-6A reductase
VARGPFDVDGEVELLRTEDIDTIVTKNSGGSATVAKLTAARQLDLPVVMVERPGGPAGPHVETVDDAVGWLNRLPV